MLPSEDKQKQHAENTKFLQESSIPFKIVSNRYRTRKGTMRKVNSPCG